MKPITARALIALGVPALAASFGLVPFLVMKPDLPNPLASHFTSSGVPDGSMSPNSFLAVSGVMFAVGLVMCLAMGLLARPLGGVTGLGIAALGGFLSAFASGILLQTALTQRGLASWTEASFSWPLTLFMFVLALGVAAIAARLATYVPALAPTPVDLDQPVMALQGTEQAVWSGQLRSGLLLALGIVALFFAAFIGVATSNWISVAVMLVSAVAILSLASLRVRADRVGLHVRYGLLPWPRTDIAIDAIAAASVIDVRPKEWGGWGYRGSLTVMKQAAVVLRAGPGIRLDLRNGKVFVVTVDNPETAVGLLNAQIQRVPASS